MEGTRGSSTGILMMIVFSIPHPNPPSLTDDFEIGIEQKIRRRDQRVVSRHTCSLSHSLTPRRTIMYRVPLNIELTVPGSTYTSHIY
jgi:hypothetical protein